MAYLKTPQNLPSFTKPCIYTIALFLVQTQWVSQLPFPSLRVDLLLPVMFGIAMEWSPLGALFWACLWGYVVDTFSGKFYGLHVASYVAAVCLVNVAVEKFEFQNPVYQMSFVGACGFGQSVILGAFLLFEPSGPEFIAAMWQSLVVRSVLMALIAPLVIYPLWNSGRDIA